MNSQSPVAGRTLADGKDLLIDVAPCAPVVTSRNIGGDGVQEMLSSPQTETAALHADLSAQLKAIEDKLRAIEERLLMGSAT